MEFTFQIKKENRLICDIIATKAKGRRGSTKENCPNVREFGYSGQGSVL